MLAAGTYSSAGYAKYTSFPILGYPGMSGGYSKRTIRRALIVSQALSHNVYCAAIQFAGLARTKGQSAFQ